MCAFAQPLHAQCSQKEPCTDLLGDPELVLYLVEGVVVADPAPGGLLVRPPVVAGAAVPLLAPARTPQKKIGILKARLPIAVGICKTATDVHNRQPTARHTTDSMTHPHLVIGCTCNRNQKTSFRRSVVDRSGS